MLKIAITGAAGRMGRRIAALAIESEQYDIVSALEEKGHPAIGKDVGELAGVGPFGLNVTETLQDAPNVLVDFTTPDGTMHWLEVCSKHGLAMVIGTTALTESQQAEIAASAEKIPIVKAANFSPGVNLLLKLVAQTARALGEEYDVEISETHHRFKKDAPSGTAVALARSICSATGAEYGDAVIFGRGGYCPRRKGEIGIHAVRLGDTVGEHTVQFGAPGETITLGHCAHTRDIFVRGAMRAVQWLADKKPGLYSMNDVLGIE